MRDLAETLRRWHTAGEPYALATVTEVTGSAPCRTGPALAVDRAGAAAGTVSAGCVDAEVYELCREALRTGRPSRRRFAPDPDEPFAPWLPCGGAIEVAIRRVDPAADPLPPGAARDGRERPRLLIFGAVQFADALAAAGRFLGYRVTVCDARAVFATPERVPDADEVVVQWPDRYLAGTQVDGRSAICVLTHDAKFDVPALLAALRSPAGDVGALGSRRTCADRARRLREAGLEPERIARLRAPIGLDLGASTPEQVALSICAEIVAVARGGSGRPLRDVDGPLHRRQPSGAQEMSCR
ncbi:XdhC family protein [Actinocrinis puniceicyclus]|uniref:XdhC family protein n=1 Tax=Actinocrinis puniceicyclus TaxID=977794 RepID=A0A8J7WRU8_9ACTN|nr:XdhC/CoxI family protein [Actinocrinis puniceicyclus]MBS2964994.1 XdhC family protein [Actinocrinis puniceicyclus]